LSPAEAAVFARDTYTFSPTGIELDLNRLAEIPFPCRARQIDTSDIGYHLKRGGDPVSRSLQARKCLNHDEVLRCDHAAGWPQ